MTAWTICGIDRLPFAEDLRRTDRLRWPRRCGPSAGSSAVRLLLDRLQDPYKPRDKVVIAGKLENG